MKKVLTLAALATLAAGVAGAQPTTLNPVFEKVVGGTAPADAPSWFANDNTTRGGAMNVASTEASGRSVIIVSRNGAPAVHVVSFADGSDLRTLDISTVAGGVFTLNVAAVAPDGKVYVSNLINTTGAGAGLKVYEWADDASATVPANIANDTFGLTHRCGDAMTVTVSGNNRTVYVVGNNAAAKVASVASTDGGSSWTTSEVGPTRAALGVAAPAPGGTIFLKSPSADIVEYDQAGNIVNTLASTDGTNTFYANGSTTTLKYAEFDSKQYLAVASYAGGSSFQHQVIDITNRAAVVTDYVTLINSAILPGNSNINGTAAIDVAVVDNNVTVFGLASNNVYGLYQAPLPSTNVSGWEMFN